MLAPSSLPWSYSRYSVTRSSVVSHVSVTSSAAALAMRRCWRPAKVQSPTGWPRWTVRVGSGPLPSICQSVMPADTSIGYAGPAAAGSR